MPCFSYDETSEIDADRLQIRCLKRLQPRWRRPRYSYISDLEAALSDIPFIELHFVCIFTLLN